MNPMKQILDFKYSSGIFNHKIRFSKIHPQNRLGEFETPTPGVLLTDLIFELKYQNHNLVIQANNIFDKIHYNHLSRIKSITPEPGRNFHLIYNLRI
jgi:outer membrane receptor protein involved in Fe transport